MWTRTNRLAAWRDEKEMEIERAFKARMREFSPVYKLLYGRGETVGERFDRAFAKPFCDENIEWIFEDRERALEDLSKTYKYRRRLLLTIHYISPTSLGNWKYNPQRHG